MVCSLLVTVVNGLPQQLPLSGDDGRMGGIFGLPIPVPGLPSSISNIVNTITTYIPTPIDTNAIAAYLNIDAIVSTVFTKGKEYPRERLSVAEFYSPGTGKYPAHFFPAPPSLPNHVIYAPKEPPADNIKMPVMVWGNGLCLSSGTAYGPFLKEVASHGYIVIATGPTGAPPPSMDIPSGILPGPNGEKRDPKEGQVLNGFSGVKDMLDSIKWVVDGNADKYGNVDKDSFITAGSSCGGLEAYSAAYHNDRVKLIGVFNSGVIDSRKRPLLREIKAKVAYITGGPDDISWQNGLDDYASLPMGLPAFRADLDTGHLGTFFAKNGGKYGEVSVALFNWVFRGDIAGKAMWTDPNSSGSMASKGWNVTYRNFDG